MKTTIQFTKLKQGQVVYHKSTRTGYIPSWKATNFKNKQNQDAANIIENFLDLEGNYFFSVFDGHGVNGAKVSNMVKDSVPNNIKRLSIESFESMPPEKVMAYKTMTSWIDK